MRLADDVPPDVKRRRLNTLLAVQERIGLERNRSWVGRAVEVLVEAVVLPRSHEHEEPHATGERTAPTDGQVGLSGRSRQHRQVHLEGDPSLVGRFVNVRVDHAGPYSLRGERC